jgi:ABC-type nitrate/sulfonate/bicarbonate transport system permease component
MKQYMHWWRSLAAPLLLIALWEGWTRLGGVDAVFLPPPSTVLRTFWRLSASGELWHHLASSMTRVAMGYALAGILGISAGLLLGSSRRLAAYIDPLIEVFRPVSPISIIPLAILWFGIGEQSKVFLIAYATFFPVLLGTIAGVRNADRVLSRAAAALGASHFYIIRTVIIPSAIPYIYTSLRISMGIALIVIVSAEMVAADQGIGWFILDSERVYKTDYMLAGIVTISLTALVVDRCLKVLRDKLLPWWREGGQ